jgi:alkylation response protein AidB-like acyl-CoA dehydrogenase
LLEVLDDDGRWETLAPALHARWVRALIDLRVARLLAYRAVGDSSGVDPAAAAVARIVTTTCDQNVAEVLVDAAGPGALDAGKEALLHGAIDDHWRYAQAATVASGTIEVQRMLVSRSVLGSSR